EVIIAGAGGAAHLPGMCASKTLLPVLGVPVESKALHGMDSLLSIVQMPAGGGNCRKQASRVSRRAEPLPHRADPESSGFSRTASDRVMYWMMRRFLRWLAGWLIP